MTRKFGKLACLIRVGEAGNTANVQEAREGSSLTLRYRRLVELDVPAIARIHRRACLVAYAFMNWSYSEPECKLWYEGKFQEWDWGLIAEDDRAPIGFIAVTGAHLDQLFVDPDYQRRGIGTYLLREAWGEHPQSPP